MCLRTYLVTFTYIYARLSVCPSWCRPPSLRFSASLVCVCVCVFGRLNHLSVLLAFFPLLWPSVLPPSDLGPSFVSFSSVCWLFPPCLCLRVSVPQAHSILGSKALGANTLHRQLLQQKPSSRVLRKMEFNWAGRQNEEWRPRRRP